MGKKNANCTILYLTQRNLNLRIRKNRFFFASIHSNSAHAKQLVAIGTSTFLVFNVVQYVGQRRLDVRQLHVVTHRAPFGSVHVLGRVTESRSEIGLDDGVFVQTDGRIVSAFEDAVERAAEILAVEIPRDFRAGIRFEFFLLDRRVIFLFVVKETLEFDQRFVLVRRRYHVRIEFFRQLDVTAENIAGAKFLAVGLADALMESRALASADGVREFVVAARSLHLA